MHIQHAVFDDAGTNGNGQIHFARKTQIAAGAAVQATLDRLQLVDDFHRPHLGRAGQRAGGEGGAEYVEIIDTRREQAFDVGHDVHDMGVALDDHLVGDLDAAGLRDAANIVARQIDQHDMFGAFFFITQQFFGQGAVLLRRGATRAGAGQRADGDLAAVRRGFLTHKNFRRGANHLKIAEVVVIHVGRGIQRTQRAVQGQR